MRRNHKKMVRFFLQPGFAQSKRQAKLLAAIACDMKLSDPARAALMLIGLRAGPDFDPGEITPAQIAEATRDITARMELVWLAMAPPEGNA